MPSNRTPTDEPRKTLHLNGLDFENFEAQPEPVDHEEDKAVQERFEGDSFYGSARGIKKMVRADRETQKFNDLTRDERIMPEINHERHEQSPRTRPDL
ncbi:MAG TPA: hypothetical protein VEF76_04730 [Patescibacteria group bacterium]|nr:hypothetical protein [Patescibacteria group bacterium]